MVCFLLRYELKVLVPEQPCYCIKLNEEKLINLLVISLNTNRLLTERECRSGEYWPEVMAVWTERSEVRTAMTSGQYSPVRLWQASLVTCFLEAVKIEFKTGHS